MSNMSLQYDQIGSNYEARAAHPIEKLLQVQVTEALGDIKGVVALDLACGTGRFSRILADLGAKTVTGYDISPVMVEAAKAATKTPTVSYEVADCSKPLPVLDFMEGQFDLVTGFWLLNYAADEEDMNAFWRNIARALKPKGRFVGIVPHPEFYTGNTSAVFDSYGTMIERLENTDLGCRVRVTNPIAKPPIQFVCYQYEAALYEKCAQASGMGKIRWYPCDVPQNLPADIPSPDSLFWDEYRQRAVWRVFDAIRD